jgi:hypothetical protein
MSKAAKNERIRLKATFLNNTAVGTIVGGAVLPTFTIYAKAFDFWNWLGRWWLGEAKLDCREIAGVAVVMLVVAVASVIVICLRAAANSELGKIED